VQQGLKGNALLFCVHACVFNAFKAFLLMPAGCRSAVGYCLDRLFPQVWITEAAAAAAETTAAGIANAKWHCSKQHGPGVQPAAQICCWSLGTDTMYMAW
jgi:hypothetical protein